MGLEGTQHIVEGEPYLCDGAFSKDLVCPETWIESRILIHLAEPRARTTRPRPNPRAREPRTRTTAREPRAREPRAREPRAREPRAANHGPSILMVPWSITKFCF